KLQQLLSYRNPLLRSYLCELERRRRWRDFIVSVRSHTEHFSVTQSSENVMVLQSTIQRNCDRVQACNALFFCGTGFHRTVEADSRLELYALCPIGGKPTF